MPTSPLCVRLFGTPRVSYAGEPVRFVAARTLPLFAYLLLERERSFARDQLAYKFWPDSSEARARANLRRHLHRINGPLVEATGHRWLETDGAIAFDRRMPLDLDVATLEAAGADSATARDAVELYAGELCEGCDDEWLLPHRERLRTTYLRLLAGLVGRYRGERRFADAIALSQRILHVDPFREHAVRTLMSLHYESGDRSSALGEYRIFRERLQSEIGAEPMRETQSLHDAIRRHAAVATSQADRIAPAVALPFEGRAHELDALRQIWNQAAGGRGRVAIVSGEAGIGKTRLLREFVNVAESEGARVLWGASSAPEASPFEPVVDALAGALGEIARLPLAPALFGALAQRFPELRAMRPDIPESVGLIDRRERERFFDAIAMAAERLTATRPTVAVFEDLHWVRADTLELIARIVRTCASAPFLAILSCREEDMPAASRAFAADPAMKRASRIALRRLEPDACRKILTLGHAIVTSDVAEWAIGLARGNPLFLSELIAQYDGGARDVATTLPTSLETAILTRLETLSEGARTLLDIAAVGGTLVSIDLLQYASGWPLAEVLDMTDELVDRAVLRETAAGSRSDYQFAHELVRDAVAAAMPPAVAARRHRRFARAILQLFPDRGDEYARTLAQHFERAGRPDEAARYYARAAHVAHDQYAWRDAMTFAEHALRLERGEPERFASYGAIESAASTCGDGERQSAAITAMLGIADALDDDALRATALRRSSEYGLQTGDAERQREAATALEALAIRARDPASLAAALRCRARGEIAFGRPARAVTTMGAIDAIERLDRSQLERFEDLRVLAHAQAASADFSAALATIVRAEALAGARPALAERLAIVRTRAMLSLEMSDRTEAARLAPILRELCRKVGDVEGEGNALQHAARIDWWLFDVASARRHVHAAIAIFARIGKLQSRASIAINAGALENHVGLLDDAERYYSEALGYADRLGNATLRSLCHGNFAYAALLRGDAASALAAAQRALTFAGDAKNERLRAIALGHRGSALRAIGDSKLGLDGFVEALKLCDAFGFADERLELVAEMLPTLVALGDFVTAATYASELERAVSRDPAAVVMPAHALSNAADAYRAAGDEAAADAVRDRARAVLADRLQKLPDARTRGAYADLRVHRSLMTARVP